MNFLIREASVSDAEAIQKLNRDEMGYDFSVSETKEKIVKISNSKSDKIFVAVIGGKTEGYIHANNYELLYAPRMINIMGIAVSKMCQRNGIGKALIMHTEAWAKETGAAGIRLISGLERTEAHDFYCSLGYIQNKHQLKFAKYFND